MVMRGRPMLRLTGIRKPMRRNKMRTRKFTSQPLALRQKVWDNKLTRMMARPTGSMGFKGGKLLIGDKLMQRINSNRIKRDTLSKTKTRGFRVSRFEIHSWPVADLTDASFSLRGITKNIKTTSSPRLLIGTNKAAGTLPTNESTDQIMDMEFLFIYAQWPGSALTWTNQRFQGTGELVQPGFGLLPANQLHANNNYQWNTRAVDNVYPLYSNAKLANDNLDLIFRKILVYKSSLKIELKNNNTFQKIKVHLVHLKIKSYSVQLADGTCAIQGNLNTMMKLFVNGKSDASLNRCRESWTKCVKDKKLPINNFITKSWKTVTLGVPMTYNNSTIAGTRNPPSERTITFKYGRKDWTRTGCQSEGTLFTDDVLGEAAITKTPTQLVIFHEIEGDSNINSTNNSINTFLDFKIHKTNVWREYN